MCVASYYSEYSLAYVALYVFLELNITTIYVSEYTTVVERVHGGNYDN